MNWKYLQYHSYGITFNPEEAATAPNHIDQRVFPSLVPNDYSLIDQSVTPAMLSGFLISDEGTTIFYCQSPLPHDATADTWIGVDAEDTTRTSQIIGDYLVEIVRLEESYSLHWTDNSYVYSLELPNSISMEVMVEIFYSIQPLE